MRTSRNLQVPVSVDWAGGGVVTTMDDLLLFLRALTGNHLVSEETLAGLTTFEHDLDKGIGYGMGVMQLRFSELSPLSRRPCAIKIGRCLRPAKCSAHRSSSTVVPLSRIRPASS